MIAAGSFVGPPLCAGDCLRCVYPDCYKYMGLPKAKPAARPKIEKIQKNRASCKRYYEKKKERFRAYYEKNRERIAAYQKAYRQAHKEKIKAYQKEYREKNAEALREKKRAYREQKRAKRTD